MCMLELQAADLLEQSLLLYATTAEHVSMWTFTCTYMCVI